MLEAILQLEGIHRRDACATLYRGFQNDT